MQVYRRGSGWSVRWRDGGKQREKRGFTRKADAEEWADRLRRQLRHDLPAARTLTIRELLGAWWDRYATKRERATIETYATAVRRILDDSGGVDAARVSTADVVHLRDRIATQASPRATNIVLTVLSSAYQRHVEWGILPMNPVRGVRRIPETRRALVVPTPEEIRLVAWAAPSPMHLAMLLVAAYCGPRQSELFALQWRDLQDGRLLIRRAKDRVATTKGVKTGSERVVPVPAFVMEQLQRLPRTGEWVFPNQRGNPYSRSPFLARVWLPWRRGAAWSAADAGCGDVAQRVADLQWRHLRHFYASSLAAVGAGMLQCSRWMGHSGIGTTMDRYGELFDGDAQDVMDLLGARF